MVIAGSGIAGIAAADAALEKGLKTLVLDTSRDVGFTLSGAMFISESTFRNNFSKFSNHINGQYKSVQWETNMGDTEETLKLKYPVYSMDREKLVRSMAVNAISRGATLKIMSKVLSIKKNGDFIDMECSMEGKKVTIQTTYFAMGHNNYDDPLLKHSKTCRKKSYYGNYSRGASMKTGKTPILRITGDLNSFRVMATWGNMWEKISYKYHDRDDHTAITSSRMVGNAHDCLPETEKNIVVLGKLLGTKNLFGLDAGNSHQISKDTVTDLIEKGWDEAMEKLKLNWSKYMNSNHGYDDLTRFLYHIPIGR